MDIYETIKKAKEIATKPAVATGFDAMTTNHMESMNITPTGSVVVKNTIIVVPINILSLTSFKSIRKRIVLNRFTFEVVARIDGV